MEVIAVRVREEWFSVLGQKDIMVPVGFSSALVVRNLIVLTCAPFVADSAREQE